MDIEEHQPPSPSANLREYSGFLYEYLKAQMCLQSIETRAEAVRRQIQNLQRQRAAEIPIRNGYLSKMRERSDLIRKEGRLLVTSSLDVPTVVQLIEEGFRGRIYVVSEESGAEIEEELRKEDLDFYGI